MASSAGDGNSGQEPTPNKSHKKKGFFSKLFGHKSKNHSNSADNITGDQNRAEGRDLLTANNSDAAEGQRGAAVNPEGLDNEENAQLEQALLDTYQDQQQLRHRATENSTQTSTNNAGSRQQTVAPQQTSGFLGDLKGLLYGIVAPFYILGMALYYLGLFLHFLLTSLAGVAGARGHTQAPATHPAGGRGFIRDHPLIAVLVLPITIIISIIEAVARSGRSGPRTIPQPSRPAHQGSRDCLIKFFQFFSQSNTRTTRSVSTPRFMGRPAGGRPCKCRCNECTIQ